MEHDEDKVSCDDGSCINSKIKNQWTIGIVLVILVTIFSFAIFNPKKDNELKPSVRQGQMQQQVQQYPQQQVQQYPQQQMQQPLAQSQAAQQVAFMNFNTVPAAPRCRFCGFSAINPIYGPNGAVTCPNCTRNLPMPNNAGGGFNQVAFQPRNNMNPNYVPCFPQGQPVAFTNPLAPPITRKATMIHPFRGVCSNCHQILETPAGAAVR